MTKRPIIFVHVPKTAGSTIHAVLSDKYENCFTIDGVDPEKSLRAFEKLSAQEKESVQVIKGHLSLRIVEQFNNPFLFTYLRDPFDQFLSAFYYIKRADWNPHNERVTKLDTLEQYIDYAEQNGLDNIQTRHLSNSIQAYPEDAFRSLGNESSTLLEKAKENLNRMDWVFHTNQFDTSLLILQKELNWATPPYYEVRNKTKGRKKTSDVSATVRDKILALNALDVELFEHSKEINLVQMSKHELMGKLSAFDSGNKRYQLRSKVGRYFNKFT